MGAAARRAEAPIRRRVVPEDFGCRETIAPDFSARMQRVPDHQGQDVLKSGEGGHWCHFEVLAAHWPCAWGEGI
jgi:hypothetical protein